MTWLFPLPARLFLVFKDGTLWGSGRLQEGADQQWRQCGIHTRWKGICMWHVFLPLYASYLLGSITHFSFRLSLQTLTCCEHTDSGQSFCILRMFEKVEAIANGQSVLNDRECPLLFQLDILLLVPSTCIISAVFIVHECSSDCKFIPSTTTSKVLERENIQLSGSVFTHVLYSSILPQCV